MLRASSVAMTLTILLAAISLAGGPVPVGGDSASHPPSTAPGGPGSVARFLYVANQLGGTVTVFSIDAATGQLRPAGYANSGYGGTAGVAFSPKGNYVFSSSEYAGQIWSFRESPTTGALSVLPTSPYQLTGFDPTPFGLVVHPSGQYLYASDWNQHDVAALHIDPSTGALTQVPGSPFAAGRNDYIPALTPSGQFLYTANDIDDTVSGFVVDSATGALTPAQGSPYAAPNGSPLGVAADPLGRFLYVADTGPTVGIAVFTINSSTGQLTPVPNSPFLASETPEFIALSPSGGYLYVSNCRSNSISAYAVNGTTGALTQIAGSPFAGPEGATPIAVDPSGVFLYVGGYLSDTVEVFGINPATGALRFVSQISNQSGASAMAIVTGAKPVIYTPRFAYAADQGANAISAYTISPTTGQLSMVSGSPFASGKAPASVAVTPSGRYAYAANSASGSISQYSVNPATGALTELSTSPFALGVSPTASAIDPTGTVYLATDASANFIYSYEISSQGTFGSVLHKLKTGNHPIAVAVDPTGQLVYAPSSKDNQLNWGYLLHPGGGLEHGGQRIFTGNSPSAIAIDPSGLYVYVTNQADNTISGWSINLSSLGNMLGFLTPIAGSPFPAGGSPDSILFEPTDHFAYVANYADGTVSAYSLNPGTGFLTPVAGSPFAAGASPQSLGVDVTGSYLYVTNGTTNTVTAFSIDSSTGALTALNGSPFPSGAVPVSIATSYELH